MTDPVVCCDGRVRVFVRDIRDPADPVLDHAEWQRYRRFAQADDARRFAVGRHVIKTVIGQLRGCTPDAVTVAIGERHRPFVDGAPPFSLSHSGNVVALALADAGQVGVDVEPLTKETQARQIASRICEPDEMAAFARLTPLHPALSAWCTKEAIAKAVGQGLSIDFRSILLDLREFPRIATTGAVRSQWQVAHARPLGDNLMVCVHADAACVID